MIHNKYPDGSGYVKETELGEIVFKLNDYSDLWVLNQFVDAFHSQYDTKTSKMTPNIIIPNLIDAQADRRFNKGESFGLKLVCQFLNGLDANFKIFHPHNQEVVEALMNNVEIIDNSEFIVKVLKYNLPINGVANNPDLILMASDAGGFKPLMKLCDKIKWKGETYSASKARTESGMEQLIDRQDFNGKDILIIDDICVYGSTFKRLSKLLKDRNCGKLYLAVSHITVQDLRKNPVTNYFDKVFCTNSKFNDYYYRIVTMGTITNGLSNEIMYTPKNLEIIKLF